MSEKREQQQEEIDLLQNIIFENMKILEEEPNFKIFMEIKSDIEKPKMNFHLTVTLNEEYPDKEPTFQLYEINNHLASSKVRDLESKLRSLCKEYINMPMLYQMYECILTFANEEEEKLQSAEKQLEKEIKKEEKEKQKNIQEEKQPNVLEE